MLQYLLERGLIGLLEVNQVFDIGLREDGDILNFTPALEILVTAESLDAVGVLREVPVVQCPVVPEEEAAEVEGQLGLLNRRVRHDVRCQVHLSQQGLARLELREHLSIIF